MSNGQRSMFITGISSGLGEGFGQLCLDEGWRVYGCSRRGGNLKGDIREIKCDLADLDARDAGTIQSPAVAARFDQRKPAVIISFWKR